MPPSAELLSVAKQRRDWRRGQFSTPIVSSEQRRFTEGNLYGIYLHGAEDSVVRGNVIVGIEEGRVNEAGNGVSVCAGDRASAG